MANLTVFRPISAPHPVTPSCAPAGLGMLTGADVREGLELGHWEQLREPLQGGQWTVQERAPLWLHPRPGAEAQIAGAHEEGRCDLATFSRFAPPAAAVSGAQGPRRRRAAFRALQNTAPCEACVCQALSQARSTWSRRWLEGQASASCVTSSLPPAALPSPQPKASQSFRLRQ